MDLVYAVLTALMLFAQGPLYKIYGKKCVLVGRTNDFLLNMFNFGTGVVIFIPFAFIGQSVDFMSIAWGLINGLFFASMLIFYNKSLQLGQIAFCNFMMAMAMVIPLIGGMLLFNENMQPFQWAGLAVLLVASYLVSRGQRGGEITLSKPDKRKLWLFAILGMISNGCLSLFIKFSHHTYADMNQVQFMFGSFFTALLAMTVLTATTTRFFAEARACIPNKWFVITGVAIGIVTAAGNMAFTAFSVVSNAAVFYPITGALPMLLAALISPLFKEKLTPLTIVGLGLGAFAIVLLNL